MSLLLGAGNQASVGGRTPSQPTHAQTCLFSTTAVSTAGSHIQDQGQGAEAQGGVSPVLGAGNQVSVVADHQVNPHTQICMLLKQLSALQGAIYRTKAKGLKPHGGVSLVLGAGNQASVVAGDILFKLIHEDEVVIVKTNPVNEYVGKHLE